jgi:hypothetical protein
MLAHKYRATTTGINYKSDIFLRIGKFFQNDIQFKADALFRFQMDRFRLLAPHAEKQPVPITTEFWKIILNM